MGAHSTDNPADLPCAICETARTEFSDRANRPRSVCPKCHSVERHRAFAHTCREMFGDAEGFAGKSVLLLRPDSADKNMTRTFGAAELVSFDAFPRGSPDVVGDLAAMEFEDARFDIVIANGVLATAREPGKVMAEIGRVLKPDGVVFVYESPMLGRPTAEVTEREKQVAWYGEEVLETYGVGQFRSWGLADLEKLVGETFNVRILETVDAATGAMFVWVVGAHMALPEAMFTDRRLFYSAHGGAEEYRGPPPYRCTLCDAEFEAHAGTGDCPACRAPVRTRSMPEMVREHLAPWLDRDLAERSPLLGLALVQAEEQVMRPHFPNIVRASLYGDYYEDNIGGLDVRDMSRFEDNSFSGILAVGVFDFFVEQEQALAECFRILAPGGVLMVLILPYRLREGSQPPMSIAKVRKTYESDYIPEGVEMDSVGVGRRWYVDAMRRTGFEAKQATVFDPATGVTSTWFLGRKPA